MSSEMATSSTTSSSSSSEGARANSRKRAAPGPPERYEPSGFDYTKNEYLTGYDNGRFEPNRVLYTMLSAPPPPPPPEHHHHNDAALHFGWDAHDITGDYFTAPPPPPPQPSEAPRHHLDFLLNPQYAYRPEASITPPMDHENHQQKNFQTLTTPTDSGAPGSSLMYTPPDSDVSTTSTLTPASSGYHGYSTYQTVQPQKPGAPFHIPTVRIPKSAKEEPVHNSLAMYGAGVFAPHPPPQLPAQPLQNDVIHADPIHKYPPRHRVASVLCQPLIQHEKNPHGNACIVLPTFSMDHSNLDGEVKLRDVDGRLPSVGCRSKYTLTVGELRRRTGLPENMNRSAMYGYFRKSKKKEECTMVRDLLRDHSIDIPIMQRSRQSTRFSSMLEHECDQVSKDIEMIYTKFMPVKPLARKMFLDMVSNGTQTIERLIQSLQSTAKVMSRIIASLQRRQPAVAGKVQILKNNSTDVPYHIFSLLTHGFGHPISLIHYRNYLKIIQEAISVGEQLLRMEPLEHDVLVPGEKPFRVQSDQEFERMMQRHLQPQNEQQLQ